jgi:hypothetical protein
MNAITDRGSDALPSVLQRQIEAALARRPPSLRLPPPLCERYEASQALPRALELRRAALVGSAVYVIVVLLLNPIALRHPVWMDMALQITVTPTLALLLASLFCRPDTPPLARECAATVSACCFSLITVLAVDDSPSEGPRLGFVIDCMPIVYVLLVVPLRFGGTVLFTAFSIMALTVALLLRADVAPAKSVVTGVAMLIVAVPALALVYLARLQTRRRELLLMLGELRATGPQRHGD